MKLLVGLGNPGKEYARHRHNVGFMALDAVADHYRFSPWKKRFQGLSCDGEIDGHRAVLLKPETYMNESGRSVGEAFRFLKLELSDLVVFHDELDLEAGRVKVKTGGGNAGHNGLRSISAHLGNDYVRVRIGIGHPGHKDLVSGYVLHDFAKDEQAGLVNLLDDMARASGCLMQGKPDASMAALITPVEAAKPEGGSVKPAKVAKAPHPAGERAGKQQNAMAENRRKFLQARKPSE